MSGMEVEALRYPGAVGFRWLQGGLSKDTPRARQLAYAQRLRRECSPRGQRHLGRGPRSGARKARTGRVVIAESALGGVGEQRPGAISGSLAERIREGRLSRGVP
eukprot:1231303-Alexandrium_andersonii.AAC.1